MPNITKRLWNSPGQMCKIGILVEDCDQNATLYLIPPQYSFIPLWYCLNYFLMGIFPVLLRLVSTDRMKMIMLNLQNFLLQHGFMKMHLRERTEGRSKKTQLGRVVIHQASLSLHRGIRSKKNTLAHIWCLFTAIATSENTVTSK